MYFLILQKSFYFLQFKFKSSLVLKHVDLFNFIITAVLGQKVPYSILFGINTFRKFPANCSSV